MVRTEALVASVLFCVNLRELFEGLSNAKGLSRRETHGWGGGSHRGFEAWTGVGTRIRQRLEEFDRKEESQPKNDRIERR